MSTCQVETPASRLRGILFFCLMMAPAIALAHVGKGNMSGGFFSGFMHPIMGPDHVVAMVAVGLWGAQLGAPAIWVLPVTFPLVMAFGGVLGAAGVPIPGIEIGIAVSAIVLGGMVAFSARPPIWISMILVAIFAIFHGYAHGAELPESANAVAFSIGFVVATGSLHVLGILIGTVNRWKAGSVLLRLGGTLIAFAGFYFLAAQISLK
jgi:urease accessory protein